MLIKPMYKVHCRDPPTNHIFSTVFPYSAMYFYLPSYLFDFMEKLWGRLKWVLSLGRP